jgi:hypothetical protein
MGRIKLAVAVAGTMVVLAGIAADADAESVRVRCERRPARSKISVDGNDLPGGLYTARVTSGTHVAVSPAEAAVGDEVEFDFDSARADIAAGATPIARNFIQNGRVRGQLLDAQGEVVASATVRCRVR